MRGGEIEAAEDAGRQDVAAVRHEHVGQAHLAAHRGAHADRVPLPLEGDAPGVARHLEVERALQPRHVALVHQDRRRREIVRRARERDEELAPRHAVAALDPPRLGAEAPPADAEGRVGLSLLHRLAVRLAVEHALLHHLAELLRPQALVAGALLRQHIVAVRHLAHQHHGEAVHVVGERRGGVAARELLGDQAIGLEIRPEPAMRRRHAERQQPRVAQVVIVLEGKGRLAIQCGGARRKALHRQSAGLFHQFLLKRRQTHVHGAGASRSRKSSTVPDGRPLDKRPNPPHKAALWPMPLHTATRIVISLA